MDDSVYIWEFMFIDIFDKYIKRKRVMVRDKFFLWRNSEVRKVMNRRYKYLKLVLVNFGNIELWNYCK